MATAACRPASEAEEVIEWEPLSVVLFRRARASHAIPPSALMFKFCRKLLGGGDHRYLCGVAPPVNSRVVSQKNSSDQRLTQKVENFRKMFAATDRNLRGNLG
jgi:hypothetical protein